MCQNAENRYICDDDDDDSFCLTSLLISVMMSDSSHCQNRTIYQLAYRYGAVGSIVLLHA